MSAIVDATTGKVQKYLTDAFNHVELDSGGGFGIRHESTRVFIRIRDFGDNAVVNVFAPVVLGAPRSDALAKEVATSHYIFGHLTIEDDDEGGKNVLFSHRLLGDFLDPEELEEAVRAIAITANDLDDDFAARFGGTVFFED